MYKIFSLLFFNDFSFSLVDTTNINTLKIIIKVNATKIKLILGVIKNHNKIHIKKDLNKTAYLKTAIIENE